MKKLPLVSVIMPVYNGRRFVAKAVKSILTQRYPRFELIVVDDGSTDETWQILKTLKRSTSGAMRIYRFKTNQGESAAANRAIAKARGEYIARMDADDISHPRRLEKQVAYLAAHPDIIAVGSQARVIDAGGRVIGHKGAPLTHDAIYQAFAFFNPMVHPSMMYRKTASVIYKHTFETTDDYHTFFELLARGRFANLPEELVSYRVHGANKSLTNIKEKFWTDTKVRLMAVTKLGYRAPILMFPAIVLQALIVTILPEPIIRELFFYLRGIKQLTIPLPDFSFFPIRATMKRYATSVG